jgi:hypothetical protein
MHRTDVKLHIVKELMFRERFMGNAVALDCSRPMGKKLNDHRFARHWLERLAQTDHPGYYSLHGPQVHSYQMIILMMDDAVEQRNQLRMLLRAQTALEDRELKPLAVAVHHSEHAPPAFGIADIVRNDVEMFLMEHDHLVVKLG